MRHITYEGTSYKYKDLMDFLTEFARYTTKEEDEQMEQIKEDQQM